MIIYTLVIVIILNLIDVLLSIFILGDFTPPNAYALGAIEILQISAGLLVFATAVVIQIVGDVKKEVHIPMTFNCILLSAVAIHTVVHVLPLVAAVRLAWYASTVADGFLDVYGVLVGTSAMIVIAATMAIYATLEVLAATGVVSRVLAETRRTLKLSKNAELQV